MVMFKITLFGDIYQPMDLPSTPKVSIFQQWPMVLCILDLAIPLMLLGAPGVVEDCPENHELRGWRQDIFAVCGLCPY